MVERNVKLFERVFTTQGVRITHMVLAPGEEIPWHLHTFVRDTFYVLLGPVTIFTREPDGETNLEAGETLQIRMGQPHRVTNRSARDVAVILLQGIGEYDYQALPPSS